jgi:hypothetical protein
LLTEEKVKNILEKTYKIKVIKFLNTGDEMFRSFVYYHAYKSKICNMNQTGQKKEYIKFFLEKEKKGIRFLKEVIEFEYLE